MDQVMAFFCSKNEGMSNSENETAATVQTEDHQLAKDSRSRFPPTELEISPGIVGGPFRGSSFQARQNVKSVSNPWSSVLVQSQAFNDYEYSVLSPNKSFATEGKVSMLQYQLDASETVSTQDTLMSSADSDTESGTSEDTGILDVPSEGETADGGSESTKSSASEPEHNASDPEFSR